MNLYKQYKNDIIAYTYLQDDIYIKTYGIIKKESQFYKIYFDCFNYMWQGDQIIEKLNNRGYLPINQVLQKYEIDEIEDLEEPKIKKKFHFFRKRK